MSSLEASPSAPIPTPTGPGRLLLVRFSGDVTTKAPATRRRFLQRMARNLKDALKSEDIGFSLERTHNRFFIRVDDDRAVAAVSRVFGVQSLASVSSHPWRSLPELVEAGFEIFAEAVRGHSFAVRVKRVGERSRIPIRGAELERALGARLGAVARGVDLGAPEVVARVELMPGRAFFFQENRPGHGGLPLGCEGRALSLVSGGFDSAVASWQMLKRGVALDYVFCNLGGRSHQLETLRVMKVIADRWSYGTRPHFHAIDFDGVTREIQARVRTRYWQVVLKRMMLRAATAVASEREALALVTGDAIGQVSSQTLQNLAVISGATPLPILRPLVGFNKEEIIEMARRIGTAELSAQVGEYCAMVPSKPATAAAADDIEAEEAGIDPRILSDAVAERGVFDLRGLDLDAVDSPAIQTDSIPAEATVLDLRSKPAYQGWHYPGALYLDFRHAVELHGQFDRAQRYVLYCEFGLKSAHLAELMRRKGLDASHFAGGLKAVIRYAAARGLPTPEI